MPTRLRVTSIALLAAVAGCESDAEKTERLRDASQSDCVAVSAHELNAKSPVPSDAERNKCESARREYAAFLEGR